MRAYYIALVWLFVGALTANAQETIVPSGQPPANAKDDPNFQMLTVGNRAMLLDQRSGRSWLLAARGDNAAWIPIQNLKESSVASNWLRANLGRRPGARQPAMARTRVSLQDALRQVELESISNSEAPVAPLTVLIARERAELTRLKREYGDRHPEVVASRNRLIELLRVGTAGEEKEEDASR